VFLLESSPLTSMQHTLLAGWTSVIGYQDLRSRLHHMHLTHGMPLVRSGDVSKLSSAC